MKIISPLIAVALLISAFQLHAEIVQITASETPKRPAYRKQTPKKRNVGGTHQPRLVKQREIRKAIREKRVIVGMTPRDVRSAWGWPELTHPVQGINESTDRWTFRRDGMGLVDLYFRNGTLVRIDY
ncbi:MAG: hypothetical protein P8123_09635 [bacterium]